ncbi:MAG: c-type cytochrome [Verrucomicrobiota bacterium]|nr:c-type cytochrome [Verrucomicrobiota bacterium]
MLSKAQARAFFFGGTGLFAVAFLALTVDSMRQLPAQTRAHNITDSVRRGKDIWEANNCMGCHTLFGEGAYYAPELTKVVERRGKDWIRVFLKDPQAMFPGQRKMVQYNFTPEQIDDTISFLEWCGNVDLNGFPADPPLAANLPSAAAVTQAVLLPKPVPAIFTTAACIGCHSIAGEGGAAGVAIGAPALDEIYKLRTRDYVAEWIRDPQKIKPDTKMPDLVPAVVSEAQLSEIVNYLYSLEQP